MKKSLRVLPAQNLIASIAILIFTILIFTILCKLLFIVNSPLSESTSISIFFVLLVTTISGLIFPIYIEYKRNGLILRHPLLIIAIVVFIINLIAVSCLPNELCFPQTSDAKIIITPFIRFYSITYGLFIGLIPYLFFYLIPRLIINKKYFRFIIYFYLLFVFVSIMGSFILQWHDYLNIIKNGLDETQSTPIHSFFHKNDYCIILMMGAFSTVLLHEFGNSRKWMLLAIPLVLLELFTFAKLPIFLTFVMIVSYLIYLLILWIKKSKDNIVIGLSIVSFVVLLTIFFAFQIFYSKSGLLLSLKNLFKVFAESAKQTFSSRTMIWQKTISILGPLQYCFGYGLATFSFAIHLSYNFDPACPEPNNYIAHAHNFAFESLGEGGVIFLMINVALYAYLIYFILKICKQNKHLCFLTFLLLFVLIINSLLESNLIMHESISFMLNMFLIVPTMFIYYQTIDKVEVDRRNQLIEQATKITLNTDDSFLEKINKKLIIDTANNLVKKDINLLGQ